ncbi:MAG: hypothetical protein AAFP90_24300, partial [Planctomycetota bacterium]
PPAIVIGRGEAQSVTGGPFLTTGTGLRCGGASLDGRYIYGCYMNGVVWAAKLDDPNSPQIDVVADTGLKLIDFWNGTSQDGRPVLMALDYSGGLYQFENNVVGDDGAPFPTLLSQTGMFSDTATLIPDDGVIEYQCASEMYRDGASTRRFVGIPDRQLVAADGKSRFPRGTVFANTLVRQVSLAEEPSAPQFVARRIETQILVFDGLNWDAYTYRWNAEQTDAHLVPAAGDQVVLKVPDRKGDSHQGTHTFASRSQCRGCHIKPILGGTSFHPGQMHGPSHSPAHGPSQSARVINAARATSTVYHNWQHLVRDQFASLGQAKPRQKMFAVHDQTASLADRSR